MANVVDTVAIKMVVDASGVQDGISSTRREIAEATRIVNSMRSPLERLEDKEKRLQELFNKGAVDDIPKYERALQSLKKQKEDLIAATNKQAVVERESSQAQQTTIQKLGVLGDLVKYHVIARGASIVTSAFRETAGSVMDAQRRLDEIGDSASKLGVSASALQAMRIQADLSDVSFQSLTGGMEKLMIRSADAVSGNADLQKTFGSLGLSMEDLQSATGIEQFNQVAQAISNVTDRSQRLSIISDLFGRGNTELIMFIDNLSEVSKITDRTNAVMSDRDLEMVGMVDQSMKELKFTIEGIFNQAAVALAPALNQAIGTITEFLQDRSNIDTFIEGIRIIGNEMSGLVQFAVDLKQMFDDIAESLTDVNTEGGAAIADYREAQRLRADARDMAFGSGAAFERRQNLDRFGVADTSGFTWRELEAMQMKKQASEEAERAAKESKRAEQEASEQAAQSFSKESKALEQQIDQLSLSKDTIQALKDDQAGFNEEQRVYLNGLREEKAALEAVKFAEDEDIKAKKERLSAAENIRQSLQSAEDAAVGRLERAMDLVTTGELGQGEFDKLLEKEAKSFAKPGQDFKLSASAFGSQAAIAATLGRDQQNDSQRLESIKQSLLELVKKPSIEVAEVGAL